MMNQTTSDRVRQDCRLINQTVLKLSAPRLLIQTALVVVGVIIWFFAATWLLQFGKTIDYAALVPLGQATVDMITRISPYIWWGVVVIWTLIAYFVIRAMVDSSIRASRAASVPTSALADLTAGLSDEVIEVVLWCWSNRDEPYTLGDLRRARIEARHGRVEKIAIVRQQEALLTSEVRQGRVTPGVAPIGAAGAAPARAAPASAAALPDEKVIRTTPGRVDVEPTIAHPDGVPPVKIAPTRQP
jgi:hypothetical protein